MMKRRNLLLAGLTVAFLAFLVGCGPVLTNTMSYQGRLTDSGGNPVNGTRNFVFRLFTATTGGSPIWTETQSGVPVNNGLFEVTLGQMTPLDEANFHQPLYLEVEVQGQTLTARQKLQGSPYAFSLVPGAVVRGAIATTENYSSTLTTINLNTGQALSAISNGGTGLAGISESTTSGYGIYAQSKATGGDSSALYARNLNANGIAIWAKADGSDGTIIVEHGAGAGDFIRAWQTAPSDLRFRVTSAGQVRADGTYVTGGADFAELLPGTPGLEPGDVLVIDTDGQLVRSSSPYASNVVGVYSTKPGVLGGSSAEDDEGKVPLAVLGVVPVKVSAENGPIVAGDLLTTSSTPGHAMKAIDAQLGTVLGKALGGLQSGSGVIDMLVTLQ